MDKTRKERWTKKKDNNKQTIWRNDVLVNSDYMEGVKWREGKRVVT